MRKREEVPAPESEDAEGASVEPTMLRLESVEEVALLIVLVAVVIAVLRR